MRVNDEPRGTRWYILVACAILVFTLTYFIPPNIWDRMFAIINPDASTLTGHLEAALLVVLAGCLLLGILWLMGVLGSAALHSIRTFFRR